MSSVAAEQPVAANSVDNRTVNEAISARIASLRERADALESRLSTLPQEFLDMKVADLWGAGVYVD